MATEYQEKQGGSYSFLSIQGDLFQRSLKVEEEHPNAKPRAKRTWNYTSRQNEFTEPDETRKALYYTGITGIVKGVYVTTQEFDGKKFSLLNVRVEGNEGTDILQVRTTSSDFITLCNMLYEIKKDKVYTIAPWQFYAKDKDKLIRGLSLYEGEKNKENKIKVEKYPGLPSKDKEFEDGKTLVGERRTAHFKRINEDLCFWMLDNAIPELELRFGGKPNTPNVFETCTNVDELKKIVQSNPQYQDAAVKYAREKFNVNLTFDAPDVADDDDLPF